MIEIEGVSKVFGGRTTGFLALDDVSVTIEDNEFFTLLGPSGCGKTTLLRVIAGFIDPTRGKVKLDREDLVRLPPYKRPVNTVFQSYALFPHMTVAENIGFGLKMLNRPAAEVKKTVDEMLDLVRMTEMANRKTSEISGGQQQRVALARALAPRPKVLLLDEPLSALDYKLRKEMQIELKRLQAETGITFVFVTHDQEEALTMSDRIGVMSKGRILQIGSPREIYAHPSSRFVADFIGETNFLDARIAGGKAHFCDVEIPVRTKRADGAATLAVRPEHVRIAPAGTAGTVPAKVTNAVYFGTDSHLYLRLDDGTEIVARQQSDPAGATGPERGAVLGVCFAPDAVQVLED